MQLLNKNNTRNFMPNKNLHFNSLESCLFLHLVRYKKIYTFFVIKAVILTGSSLFLFAPLGLSSPWLVSSIPLNAAPLSILGLMELVISILGILVYLCLHQPSPSRADQANVNKSPGVNILKVTRKYCFIDVNKSRFVKDC